MVLGQAPVGREVAVLVLRAGHERHRPAPGRRAGRRRGRVRPVRETSPGRGSGSSTRGPGEPPRRYVDGVRVSGRATVTPAFTMWWNRSSVATCHCTAYARLGIHRVRRRRSTARRCSTADDLVGIGIPPATPACARRYGAAAAVGGGGQGQAQAGHGRGGSQSGFQDGSTGGLHALTVPVTNVRILSSRWPLDDMNISRRCDPSVSPSGPGLSPLPRGR